MNPLMKSILALIVLLMSACALSPQTVNIHPKVDLKDRVVSGNDRLVSLTVSDGRSSRVVGTRGGIYAETSEISTNADISPAIRAELVSGLRKLGFQVVDSGQTAAASLTVVIDTIDYTASGAPLTDSVETSATVRAQAQQGNREFSGRYRGTRTTEVLKAPGVEENEAMINAAISRVLERLLTDPKLLAFLRGE